MLSVFITKKKTHTHTHTHKHKQMKKTQTLCTGIFRAAIVMVDTFYGTSVKFIVCTITTVNSNVNYGL